MALMQLARRLSEGAVNHAEHALNDLEKIMADGSPHVLPSGETDPRKTSTPCQWSTPDFEAFGDDPRGIAAKGFYFSAFIPFGAKDRKTVKESEIRDLYIRSSASWHAALPHILLASLDGLGSEQSMSGARCMRFRDEPSKVPQIIAACAQHDEGTRHDIRELTMGLVIDPSSAAALDARAEKYLELAQGAYADNKPSRALFDLAIKDFTEAIAANPANLHSLYVDRALALASIGKYEDAAASYLEGMKHGKHPVEESPFVYEQLAGVYMELGRFNDAAAMLTEAIINTSGGGMDVVIFGGGLRAFRLLYPQYDLLPDEILAEDIRRRYEPQFSSTWDADFISKTGAFQGRIASTVLADLYALRGDAYMRAGHREEALADYRRIKSDAWSGEKPLLPRNMYFDEHGRRNFIDPGPWPPSPPPN
jgi:hypothetical protein